VLLEIAKQNARRCIARRIGINFASLPLIPPPSLKKQFCSVLFFFNF
jgi:hypothetical protein